MALVPQGRQSTNDTVVASNIITATGNTAAFDNGYAMATSLTAQINVSAVSGVSASVTFILQDSVDGTNWNTLATFTAVIAPGIQVQRVTNEAFGNQLRLQYTVAATVTPSFTFSAIVLAKGPRGVQ
jgi:hypothetical protein